MVRVWIIYFGEDGHRDFNSFEEAKAFIDDCDESTIAYFDYNGKRYSNQCK